MNAVPGWWLMKSGAFGFVPSLMFVSESGTHELVKFGYPVLSHMAMPNQNAGWSSKSQELPPAPAWIGGGDGWRGSVTCQLLLFPDPATLE